MTFREKISTEFGSKNTSDLLLGEVRTSVPYRNQKELSVFRTCQPLLTGIIHGCDILDTEISKNSILKANEAEF